MRSTYPISKMIAAAFVLGFVHFEPGRAAEWSTETCDAMIELRDFIKAQQWARKINGIVDPTSKHFEDYTKAMQLPPVLGALTAKCGVNTHADAVAVQKTTDAYLLTIVPNPNRLKTKVDAKLGVPVRSPPVASSPQIARDGTPLYFPPTDLDHLAIDPLPRLAIDPSPGKPPSFNCVTMNEVYGNGSTTHCNPE